MKNKKHSDLSKLLSYLLRHNPESIGLKLNNAGWADVNELVLKINNSGKSINIDKLNNVVKYCDKNRFSFNENRTSIRANQGHSIEVNLGYQLSLPPDILYHGTGNKNEESILNSGILKMKRQHVHLSDSIKTAINVGTRHGKPIVFQIKSQKMNSEGYTFYKSENDIWLTNEVPVKYLKRLLLI